MINGNSKNLKIEYLKGTWLVIATAVQDGRKIYLLESEQRPGDTTVVDEEGKHVELK